MYTEEGRTREGALVEFFCTPRLLLFFLRATYGTAVLLFLIGLTAVSGALAKTLLGHLVRIPVMAVGLLLAMAVIKFGLSLRSQRSFLIFVTTSWLISRAAIILLCPSYVPSGDEVYFHSFVGSLVGAMASGTIHTLGNLYDFPVWLARSFPLYLPLAQLFGAHDLWAARWLNLFLGAAQVIFLFFIAKRLLGGRIARLSCLLLLISPYHLINVLSYEPQVAGTFFLLLAVWMFLCLNSGSAYSTWALAGIGLCLGLSLFFAGIQRGGVDLLLVAVMLVAGLIQRLSPAQNISSRNRFVCLLAVVVIWFPLRHLFGEWVASQDAYKLRSHTLGFMTRGWNLESSGEYLPLYEQLDVSTLPSEKQRTLEAVLATEFANQPVRSLLMLPPVKVAKFFALGYASTAEEGIEAAGYRTANLIYRSTKAIYAVVILALCLWGLVRCWQSAVLQARLLAPALLVVLSCTAILLIWETSPRYSHPIQFAMLMLAAIGIVGFPRSWTASKVEPRLLFTIASSAATVVGCWLVISALIAGAARAATTYHLLDPRLIGAQLDGKAIALVPLHPFSESWEASIDIPSGTALPARVQIAFPVPRLAAWNHLSVSIWQGDVPSGPDPGVNLPVYQVRCQTPGRDIPVPAAASGHISRIVVPRTGDAVSALTLSIDSNDGLRKTASELKIGIGYALAN